jgi:hypothetical protein
MSRAAWSFVAYSCGHSTPVRGGDRVSIHPCPACAALRRLRQLPDNVNFEQRVAIAGDVLASYEEAPTHATS